jgi:uncharacterized protein YjeT (DUF2065 family)
MLGAGLALLLADQLNRDQRKAVGVHLSLIGVVTTMSYGLKPARVRRIREALQIESRTLKRWRRWWLDRFVRSSFRKAARARFMPPVCEQTLPLSLWLGFKLQGHQQLLAVLEFLSPITTPTAWKELAV